MVIGSAQRRLRFDPWRPEPVQDTHPEQRPRPIDEREHLSCSEAIRRALTDFAA
jgi:hypothetical protein